MTDIPRAAKLSCNECGADVAYAVTPRRSRGEAVEILIDYRPDTGHGGNVPIQVKGDTVYGDAVPKHMADAMRAQKRELHALHKDTCVKRNSSRKRS